MVVSNKTTTPLISAGVGTPTKLANWKQSSWNNILLNPPGPLVDIFERNTWEPWDKVFNLIKDDILKIININTLIYGRCEMLDLVMNMPDQALKIRAKSHIKRI